MRVSFYQLTIESYLWKEFFEFIQLKTKILRNKLINNISNVLKMRKRWKKIVENEKNI